MSATDDERLTGLAASLARDDPRFARSLDEGRPAAPRGTAASAAGRGSP
ncbi:hypothetical protein ACKI10_04765 [Streptomyces galilaeus]|uniref:Uncharacterized protein n=1 Tax=Streptomyces galilaeus TaxID=33899 RepID=A0ABW9IC95_STRGJ